MKKYVFLSALFFTLSMQAQSTIEDIQKEIDNTVWQPFQKAFETLDGKALNALYAADVLRVTPNGIDTQNSFKATNAERFHANRKNGESIGLDWWWDDRKTTEDTSYEVGFYRIAFTTAQGKTQYSYGQFHIVLKKIDRHWKITQDWDTASIAGIKIDSSLFETKPPLQF